MIVLDGFIMILNMLNMDFPRGPYLDHYDSLDTSYLAFALMGGPLIEMSPPLDIQYITITWTSTSITTT